MKIDYSLLVGKKFGRLSVESVGAGGKARMINCICDCGGRAEVTYSNLRSGNTTSCGCWKKQYGHIRGASNVTHGMSNTRLYRTWISMKRRCYLRTHKDYAYYGARGITVCQRWVNSFETFASDMGTPPVGASIDRVDNDLGYSPENCRWATSSQQSRNRRRFAMPKSRKLTDDQAAELRASKARGDSWSVISKNYGISISSARKVVSGESYAAPSY